MRATPGKAIAAAALVSVVLCAAQLGLGCGTGGNTVSEIDGAFSASSAHLEGATAFVDALRRFDFENADFLEDTLSALETSRSAADEMLASVEELRGFDYGGSMADLGRYIEEYATSLEGAVRELQDICQGLEEVLLAIEPVLREEAVITQMEAPRSDAELLERLIRLDAAMAASLPELEELEVPELLEEYKALFEELITNLHKVVRDLAVAASGSVPEEKMESNPDFQRVSDLLAAYKPLVDRLHESLKVTAIDSLVEKVELEINRLYIEETRNGIGA